MIPEYHFGTSVRKKSQSRMMRAAASCSLFNREPNAVGLV